MEQPTELGNLCLWLPSQNLHAYRNSEDELVEAFRNTSRVERQTVCRQYDRCRFFMSEWEAEKTPKLAEDPFEVYHHNGYYWASEGKHRICAAIQTGVERIAVPVRDVDYTVQPLDPVGNPGSFHTEWILNHRNRQWAGSLLYLYADFTRPWQGGRTIREYLGRGPHTFTEKQTEILPKIYVRYSQDVQHRCFRPVITHFHVTVDIDPDLPPGKVWLVQVPMEGGWPNLNHCTTLFRRGTIRPQTCPELPLRNTP